MMVKLSEARTAVKALRAVNLGADRVGHDGLWAAVLDQVRNARGDIRTNLRLEVSGPGMRATSGLLPKTVEQLRERVTANRALASVSELAAVDELEPLPPPECSICDGARFVRVPDLSHVSGMKITPCQCVMTEEPVDILRLSHIPVDYRGMCFENFRALPGKRGALEAMMLRQPDQSVVLWGPWGNGKTHLGISAIAAAAEQGIRGRYVYVPDLLDGIRARYAADEPESATEYTEALLTAPLLLLDDLSAARWTDWARERIYVVLDRRLREGRATIVTTNYASQGEIEEAIDGAIASRLGAYQWVELAGEDMRGSR